MSSAIPIVLQPIPVSYGFSAGNIDQLLTVICQHVQATIDQEVSFFDSGATDPTTQTTPLFFNTTQQTFKVWNTILGKYVAITDNLAGDIKFTATAGDDITRGWVQCDGRLISAIPGISASQVNVAESYFGVGGNLPTLATIPYYNWTQYTRVYIGQP